ncbi:uncharacterized protein TNCV_2572041 [Trichonephila clavipes]|nr:uncharacterized protein TNCV_2572041 [Trichonephila clavipes]
MVHSIFQKNLKENLNKNIERLAEEIRWWKDSGNILKSMEERLEEKNAATSGDIEKGKKRLETQKESVLEASVKLQEQKQKVSALEKFNADLMQTAENTARLQIEEKRLRSLKVNAKKNLSELQKKFKKSLDRLYENENHIKELEDEVAWVDEYANYLANVLESARNIVADEVKQTSIKTYNGPPEQKNILAEFEGLFDEATKRIYEYTNS